MGCCTQLPARSMMRQCGIALGIWGSSCSRTLRVSTSCLAPGAATYQLGDICWMALEHLGTTCLRGSTAGADAQTCSCCLLSLPEQRRLFRIAPPQWAKEVFPRSTSPWGLIPQIILHTGTRMCKPASRRVLHPKTHADKQEPSAVSDYLQSWVGRCPESSVGHA